VNRRKKPSQIEGYIYIYPENTIRTCFMCEAEVSLRKYAML